MKRWLIILAALLIVTNAWWFYYALDHGVTLSYRDAMVYERNRAIENLEKLALLSVKGKSTEETKMLLQKLFPGSEPFVKDGFLSIDFLSFKLDAKGVVTEVVALDGETH